jgi:hypothetical protein
VESKAFVQRIREDNDMASLTAPSHRPAFATLLATSGRRAAAVLGLALSCFAGPGHAEDEVVPVPKPVVVNWPHVARDIRALSPQLATPPKAVVLRQAADVDRQLARYSIGNKEALQPLARLNLFMSTGYPGVESVPVPVLVPVDTGRYVDTSVRTGDLEAQAVKSFLSPGIAEMYFIAKKTGYDAIVTVGPDLLRRYKISETALVQVHLGGAGQLYAADKAERRGSNQGTPVVAPAIQARFPGLRRHVGTDDVTYRFTKYGVPYFASAPCQGTGPRQTEVVHCSQVDPILLAVLRELHLIGGAPIPIQTRAAAGAPARPTAVSSTFTYFAPGNLLPGTSQGKKGGVTTKLLWGPSDLSFPIKDAPAYANSQTFMDAGDCLKQKIPLSGGTYKCKQNPDKILDDREDNAENYAYPWRDDYCEERDDSTREPKDCPAPIGGHEGQDIRPKDCVISGGRCAINRLDTVAVTTGDAWWTSVNHVRLITNDGTDLYYMYLHMSPTGISSAGLTQGVPKHVVPGEKVGQVGNWLKTEPNQTTAHLHFEIRKLHQLCGDFGCTVAPYWTLIRAYERFINAQGTEVK